VCYSVGLNWSCVINVEQLIQKVSALRSRLIESADAQWLNANTEPVDAVRSVALSVIRHRVWFGRKLRNLFQCPTRSRPRKRTHSFHLVGRAGSPTRSVYVDVTLIRSNVKVKVTDRLKFRKSPCWPRLQPCDCDCR